MTTLINQSRNCNPFISSLRVCKLSKVVEAFKVGRSWVFFFPFLEKDESWPTEAFLLKNSLEITCSLEGKRGRRGGGNRFFS